MRIICARLAGGEQLRSNDGVAASPSGADPGGIIGGADPPLSSSSYVFVTNFKTISPAPETSRL